MKTLTKLTERGDVKLFVFETMSDVCYWYMAELIIVVLK